MASAQSKRQKLSAGSAAPSSGDYKETSLVESIDSGAGKSTAGGKSANNFGVDVDDLTDDTDSEEEEDADEDEPINGGGGGDGRGDQSQQNHVDIQEQLAAAGPAGVAAAAAIATARKRKRSHSFETNPSVRKRQQTRLIRKLRACLDEYTMRVGQQAVVLITMPGKAQHNFKVFGAQPLESVIRACKSEIMAELEQALLEQAPQQFKNDTSKHELPPLVIDGIPTPVEKMTQAQLRAFIPLMLKYSTGRGKPGWGKDTTRPPWWPETLPWANVRSDARNENEKQRISWTTTLRQIVTNCYKFHGRDDLLPTFDELEEARAEQEQQLQAEAAAAAARRPPVGSRQQAGGTQEANGAQNGQQQQQQLYTTSGAYAGNFVHTISDGGTMSLIQVDPANAQILTLPDGTQVRAVRLQTLGADALCAGQQLTASELPDGLELAGLHQQQLPQLTVGELGEGQTLTMSEASLGPDGQIIVTGEDGVQSCYPMSQLVSIPASVYQQFAQGGQQLSIMTADGQALAGHTLSLHAIQEPSEMPSHEQQPEEQAHVAQQVDQQQQSMAAAEAKEEAQSVPPDGDTGDGGETEGADEAGKATAGAGAAAESS